MNRLVTISLVFFSLTHLAKAEQRVDSLRLVTEAYCNRQQLSVEQLVQGENHPQEKENHFFLSYSELALTGIVTDDIVPVHHVPTHITAYLTIRQNAKNNSP